jgi:hypothetical protein
MFSRRGPPTSAGLLYPCWRLCTLASRWASREQGSSRDTHYALYSTISEPKRNQLCIVQVSLSHLSDRYSIGCMFPVRIISHTKRPKGERSLTRPESLACNHLETSAACYMLYAAGFLSLETPPNHLYQHQEFSYTHYEVGVKTLLRYTKHYVPTRQTQ